MPMNAAKFDARVAIIPFEFEFEQSLKCQSRNAQLNKKAATIA